MKAKKLLLVAMSTTLLASCGGQQINAEQAEVQLKAMQAKIVNQEITLPTNVSVRSEVRMTNPVNPSEKVNGTTEFDFYAAKTYIHQKINVVVGEETQNAETWIYVRENQFVFAADVDGNKVYTTVAVTTTPEEHFEASEEVIEFAKELGVAIGEAYNSFQAIFDMVRSIDDAKIEIEAMGASLAWSADFETKNEGHLKGTFNAEAKKDNVTLTKEEVAIEFDNYVPTEVYALTEINGQETTYAKQTFDWKVGTPVYPDLSGWQQA